MINLYRDPQCKSVTVYIKPEDIPGTTTTDLDSFANAQNVETLQKKIKELESRVQLQQRQIKYERKISVDITSGCNMESKRIKL